MLAETIDWKDGEDPQLWSIIPIEAEEIARLKGCENEQLLVHAVKGFSPQRRSLCLDWPKGGDRRIFWRHGVIVGLHD